MGLRKQKRAIARARLQLIGVGNVNQHFSETNVEGVPNWKVALMDEKAHQAQTAYFRKNRRKVRRIRKDEKQ